MARRVANRKELRDEAETAEREAKPAAPKKRSSTKKARAAAPQPRVKLYWGVFSPSMKRVAIYEFSERAEADKKAEELSKDGKSPHFVQKVKETVA